MSRSGSLASTRASSRVPSEGKATSIRLTSTRTRTGTPWRSTMTSSPLTTWWFVITYPAGETTNPLPVATSISGDSTVSFQARWYSARTTPNIRMNTVAREGCAPAWLLAGRAQAASARTTPAARRQEEAVTYFPGGLAWPRTPVRMR